ncbi:MAG: hypothetical protein Q4C40_04935 [Eubacteriales bacterium]|nr:hypothetical protein [Eubacteriales bacterium]
MKLFENDMNGMNKSMMLGMKMMYGGNVTRAEFDDMLHECRAKH